MNTEYVNVIPEEKMLTAHVAFYKLRTHYGRRRTPNTRNWATWKAGGEGGLSVMATRSMRRKDGGTRTAPVGNKDEARVEFTMVREGLLTTLMC